MPRVRIKEASKLVIELPSIDKPRLRSTLPWRSGEASQSPLKQQPKFNLLALSSSLRYKKPAVPGFADTMAASLAKQRSPSPLNPPETLPDSNWNVNRQQNALAEVRINPANINPADHSVSNSEEANSANRDHSKFGTPEFTSRIHIYPVF